MRLARAAFAIALLAAGSSAGARTVIQQDVDQNGFKLYGLPTYDRDTGAVRLLDNPRAVTNITALEAIGGTIFHDGVLVFVQSFDAFFEYRASSSLTVDHKTVASVSGAAGARWLRVKARSPKWSARTTWYVDPANVTATASDENDGASSGAALVTWAELGRRLYAAHWTANVTANAWSTAPNTDPLILEGISTDGFPFLTILGNPTVIDSGRTISTPHAPASASANDHYEITDGTATFAPWIANYLLHKTNGTQSWFWLYRDLGSGKGQISAPITASNTVGTLSNGDTYRVLDLPGFAEVLFAGTSPFLTVKISQVRLLGSALIGSVGTFADPGYVTLDRSVLTTQPFIGGTQDITLSLQNICLPASAGGMSIAGSWGNVGGLYVGNGTTTAMTAVYTKYLGGNAANVMTLGGIRLDVSHEAHMEKLQAQVYDWAGGATPAIGASHNAYLNIQSIGGERNTGKLVAAGTFGVITSQGFASWNSAITTDASPYTVNGVDYGASALGVDTNQIATTHTGIADLNGAWSGDLSGAGINPSVVAIHETGGPTRLTFGAIGNGQALVRSGLNIVGGTISGFVPTSRTLTPDIGIVIDGGTSPVDLSANRTIGARFDNVSITSTIGGALQRAAISGDGTVAAGANTFALVNIPSGTTMAGSLLATAIAAPGTPASGKGSIYVDSTSKNLAVKDDAGVVKHGVRTKASVASNFLTAIADDGTVTAAQPSYSDLSGSVPAITSLTTDVVAAGPGAAAATIQPDVVDNTKLANMATARFKGRVTAGTGDPEDLTGAQATTLLTAFTNIAQGVTPASGGGTLNFLRADGTWTQPAYSGITGTPTLYYQTIQSAGVDLVQRPKWNASTGLSGSDNSGSSRTDVTVNLSTGITGGQSVIGGNGSGENLTLSSTVNATKGKLIFGTTAKGYFDEANGWLSIGNGTPAGTEGIRVTGKTVKITGTVSANLFAIENTANGTGDYAEFALINNRGSGSRASIYYTSQSYTGSETFPDSLAMGTAAGASSHVTLSPNNTLTMDLTPGLVKLPTSNGSTIALAFTKAGDQTIEKQGSGDFYVGTLGAQLLGLYTNNVTRLSIASGGGVTISSLAGGSTGPISVSTTGLLQRTTMPAAGYALFSAGTSADPVDHSAVLYDTVNDLFELSDDANFALYNAGSLGTGNYERLRLYSPSNVFTFVSEKGGTGTVRGITVNADTATLTLRGNSTNVHGAADVEIGLLTGVRSTPQVIIGGTTSVDIGAGATGPNPSAGFTGTQLLINTSTPSIAANVATSWDGLKVTGGATLTGTGTVLIHNSTSFAQPTITGNSAGGTVNETATVAIAGAPIASGINVNSKMALWVQADAARFDGDIVVSTTANGSVATAMSSVGPTGSHTTVQKWLKVKDTSGTSYYIPMF